MYYNVKTYMCEKCNKRTLHYGGECIICRINQKEAQNA